MPKDKIGVIILNWNGRNLLKEFLPKVIANTDPTLADVIVADNGSTDDSLEVCRREFPGVRLMVFDHNYGFAGGYNRAIREVADEYDIVLLLNSDVAPKQGWIPPLYNFLKDNPTYGACQPKILSYKEPEYFEYAGASGGYLDNNGYPYCRGRVLDHLEKDLGQYDDQSDIFWASGAALCIRTKVYLDCGGLDESFFAHMEEIDLCWRIWNAGWSIAVVPSSVVYHLGGGSLPAGNPRKVYLNFRNSLLMLDKNLSQDKRTRKLFTRRLLDTLAWGKFLVSGQWKSAQAIIKAHNDFRKMRKDIVRPEGSVTPKGHPAKGNIDNILTSYYLKGRKTYKK